MTKKPPIVISCGPGGISALRHNQNMRERRSLGYRGFQFHVTAGGYFVTEKRNGTTLAKGRAASSVDEQAGDVLKLRAYQDNLALAIMAARAWEAQEKRPR